VRILNIVSYTKSNREECSKLFFPPRIYLLFEMEILGKRRKAKLKSLLKKLNRRMQKTG
jgi:hypothetical protein